MDKEKIQKICSDSPVTTLFFIIGLIATISIRAIGIAGIFSDIVTKILWYIGVIGFLLFFVYKYKVEVGRRKIIIENNIIESILNNQKFNDQEKDILISIMCGLVSKKDPINYFVIFFTSAVSLVIALIFDLGILK